VLDDERCPVCGILMRLKGLPFAQSHVYGPVLDTATGIEYRGHPVYPGEPLSVDKEF